MQKRPSNASNSALTQLASVLLHNHSDVWLSDLERAPHPAKAIQLLISAVAANYEGDSKTAAYGAIRARAYFQRFGNTAGAARSQAEYIYALRRQSNAKECLRQLYALDHYTLTRKYEALEIESAYEHAVCEDMLSNFDRAQKFAHLAIEKAEASRYPSLGLRAQALESSLTTSEGRTSQSWRIDSEGLARFWNGAYRGERGFQFYSDLQEASAHQGLWHLAAALQREAIAMLEETGRLDFKAIAYFQLGLLCLKSGQGKEARLALSHSESIFKDLPQNTATEFYRAYVEIELSRIETEEGQATEAESRLKQIGPVVERISNFIVLVPYYQSWAEVDSRLNRPVAEAGHLRKAIEVIQQGLHGLHTEQERWRQFQEMNATYHRLLELKLKSSEAIISTLQDWESFRALQFAPLTSPHSLRKNSADLAARIHALKHSTVVSFAVFSEWINVWVADDRGVQRIQIPAETNVVESEVERFASLCSDPESALEKVNSSGMRLYQMLLAPLESLLEPNRVLVIEGDGILNRIPWAALSISNQVYLGDRYTLMNSPGLFYAVPRPSLAARANHALVVYPGAVTLEGHHYEPLPNAQDEVNYITNLLPHAVSLEGKTATVERVLSEMNKASVFHFAGHADIRAAGGELLLRDGPLSASRLHTNTLSKGALVVLSACSTGVTGGDASRDPNGLVRAFLSAGASQVIATQWDVDSRASFTFSKNFYASLSHSQDVATAVSVAGRAIRSDPKTQHPYYWGAFELVKVGK